MTGSQLRQIREALGVTLGTVGKRVKYTRAYLSHLETRENGQADLPKDAEPKIIAGLKAIAQSRDKQMREAVVALLEED